MNVGKTVKVRDYKDGHWSQKFKDPMNQNMKIVGVMAKEVRDKGWGNQICCGGP